MDDAVAPAGNRFRHRADSFLRLVAGVFADAGIRGFVHTGKQGGVAVAGVSATGEDEARNIA